MMSALAISAQNPMSGLGPPAYSGRIGMRSNASLQAHSGGGSDDQIVMQLLQQAGIDPSMVGRMPPELKAQLVAAAKQGRQAEVIQMLKQGFSSAPADDDRQTTAAEGGFLQRYPWVKYLLWGAGALLLLLGAGYAGKKLLARRGKTATPAASAPTNQAQAANGTQPAAQNQQAQAANGAQQIGKPSFLSSLGTVSWGLLKWSTIGVAGILGASVVFRGLAATLDIAWGLIESAVHSLTT